MGQTVALLLLILLSGFFSSAETAFVSVNQIRMRSLAEDGNKRAAKVLSITADSSKMLSAILIGNNLVNISASSLATTLALSLWGNAAVSIATGVLTLIVLIFGEICPKTLATTFADKIALAYSGIIRAMMVALTPVIFLINKLSKVFLFLFGYNPNRHEAAITEDELRTMVDVSHEEGVIESDEHELINNVFEFGDSYAKDVMIPRIDMVCISSDSTYDEIINVFRQYKYTRFPVYEDSVDKVIGIINVKDLLLCGNPDTLNVKDILRKPYYTFEYKNVSELMEELRKTANNFSIVIDEYGSTVGMITLEDLLEEIVGEIRDEYDEDEEDDIIKVNDGEYILSGLTRLDDLREIVNLPMDEEESEYYDSIAGFIVRKLERLPRTGDEITVNNVRLVVDKCTKNRIIKVHMYITAAEEGTDEEE